MCIASIPSTMDSISQYAILFKDNVLQGDNVEVVWTMSFYGVIMAKNTYKGPWLGAAESLVKLRKPELSWQSSALWQHFLDYRKHRSRASQYVHLRKLFTKGTHVVSTEHAQKK